MQIRDYQEADVAGIKQIVDSLHPRWFDDRAVVNIPFDLNFQKAWVAIKDDKVVGFVSVRSQDGKPFIGWLGVGLAERNQGVGSALLNQAEETVKKSGGRSLRVETVVEQSPPDHSYDETIQFYFTRGLLLSQKQNSRALRNMCTAKGF